MARDDSSSPINVALANDHELVVLGLAQMLAPFPDRIRIAEAVAGKPVAAAVDVTLFDTFSQTQVDGSDIDQLLADRTNGRVVVYSWNLQPELVSTALRKGAAGYLSKSLDGPQLVKAIEAVHSGEVVVSLERIDEDEALGRWPGQAEGLTVRESEVIALITSGLSNHEIAERSYLSINSVKSYIRSAYRKMGVATRAQAVLWGVDHGFLPDIVRLRGETSVT
jgi:NarL family two-component system response regulator LiaR